MARLKQKSLYASETTNIINLIVIVMTDEKQEEEEEEEEVDLSARILYWLYLVHYFSQFFKF